MAGNWSAISAGSETREAMEAMQSQYLNNFLDFDKNKFTTFLQLLVIEEMAALLKIGLDKETLSICVRLIDNGVNPTSLAHAILDIQKEAARLAK